MNPNIKMFFITLGLCVQLSADSKELTQMSRYNIRRLLTYVAKDLGCENESKKLLNGKCVTDDKRKLATDNEDPDDGGDDFITTNVTPTSDVDDDNKRETNTLNETYTKSTPSVDKNKSIDTISSTPTPNGNNRQINFSNETSTESTSNTYESNVPETNSTMPTNDSNVSHGPKVVDKVPTPDMPNEVQNYVIAIVAAAGLAFLLFCCHCVYKKWHDRNVSHKPMLRAK